MAPAATASRRTDRYGGAMVGRRAVGLGAHRHQYRPTRGSAAAEGRALFTRFLCSIMGGPLEAKPWHPMVTCRPASTHNQEPHSQLRRSCGYEASPEELEASPRNSRSARGQPTLAATFSSR